MVSPKQVAQPAGLKGHCPAGFDGPGPAQFLLQGKQGRPAKELAWPQLVVISFSFNHSIRYHRLNPTPIETGLSFRLRSAYDDD